MLRTVLVSTAVSLVVAAPAGAQATATAMPRGTGEPSRLRFDVDATLPPVNGQIPSGISVSTGPGYQLDPAAVAKRCTKLQADLNECPGKSRIGSGTLVVHVFGSVVERDATINLELYLGRRSSISAIAFLAGNRVVPGTLTRSNGVLMTFNPLPKPPVFPGVNYALRRVTLAIGAQRVVVHRRPKPRKGKAGASKRGPVRIRKTRLSLIRNPASCPTGGWVSTVTLSYPDGTSSVLPASAACSS